MFSFFLRARLVFLGVCFWGCAGSAAQTEVVTHVRAGRYAAAVERYERAGKSRGVLESLSRSLLTQAAESGDREQQRAAFVELSLLGTRAEPLLEELSDAGRAPQLRAQALRLRLALGDEDARQPLRALASHADPTVADAGYAALDPDADWPLLLDALSSPRSARRSAALSVLGRAPGTAAGRHEALGQVARFDPEPQLRAAALACLERVGQGAAPIFEAALQDGDAEVRSAARRGVLRVDPERGRALLDQQLGAAVSSESIAAAVALLGAQPPLEAERARALLMAALTSPDATLRARAAGSLALVPEAQRDRTLLRERLEAEKVRSVRFSLALALGAADADANKALIDLSQSADLTGAQAAAELAARDTQARERLRGLTGHSTVLVRATAARLIARELHESDPLVKLLADSAWQVRSAAAGAVLSVL